MKRISKYLFGTLEFLLYYHGGDLLLTGFRDADSASNKMSKNPPQLRILLEGGAISCYIKKLSCIALFMMQSDYIAYAVTAQHAV